MTPNPCPFCLHEKVQINTRAKAYHAKMQAKREKRDQSNYACRCVKCNAKGPLCETPDDAVAAWNGAWGAEVLP